MGFHGKVSSGPKPCMCNADSQFPKCMITTEMLKHSRLHYILLSCTDAVFNMLHGLMCPVRTNHLNFHQLLTFCIYHALYYASAMATFTFY